MAKRGRHRLRAGHVAKRTDGRYVIQARVEGTCELCGQAYPLGTALVRNPETGAWVHDVCSA